MIVAIAGSRRLPRGLAPRRLLHLLLSLPPDTQVLLRRGSRTVPGQFESDVSNVCGILGLEVGWRVPNPVETPGRAAVYARDINLVNEADLTLAFLDIKDAEDGNSGTFHLFERAMQDERPVYAWVVGDDGEPERWGEYDPQERYAWLFEGA